MVSEAVPPGLEAGVGAAVPPARGALLAIALLLVVLVVAFADVLFAGRTLSPSSRVPGVLPGGPVGASPMSASTAVRDPEGAAWVDEPAPYLVHDALASGRLPLWNAREGLGLPLLGNPNTAALAPLQWPVELHPGARVQDLAWLARALALGVFTWLLARRLGCGPAGAFAAAGGLMLSGQTVAWIAHHPLHTDAFVPLALCAALGLPESGRRGVALLALAVAAGLLGLKPQSALVAGVVGVVWLVAEATENPGSTPGRRAPRPRVAARLALAAAGLGLGALLAGVALVPFAETWSQASPLVRAGRSTQSEWTVPASSAWSLLGRVAGGSPAAGLPYAGAGVLLAATAGLVRARRRPIAWALGATALLFFGRIHGLLPVSLAGIPLVGSIQFVKYCFPAYLALALLAGLGLTPASDRHGPRRIGAAEPYLAWLLAAALVAELAWNARVPRPRRVPLFTPAPWVDALRALERDRPGRMSGPADLAPPLVSGALGFRDLRSIDVLTPADAWRTLQEVVAPSRGVTWILADPLPLLAATGPGAAAVDLRWILSRTPLHAADLPGAVRSASAARRLVALLADVDTWSIETADLAGGLDSRGGEERFHWTCLTPCRMRFDLQRLPPWFALGLAAEENATVVARLSSTASGGERVEATESALLEPDASWRDLRVAAPVGAAGRPGRIEIRLESDRPRRIFAGGVGPAPAVAEESAGIERELAARTAALGALVVRHSDADATIYENTRSLGAAWMASSVVSAPDPDAVRTCVREHPGEAVACVADSDLDTAGVGVPTVSAGRATIVRDGEEELVVETASEGGGLLVFARLFHPGWHASVDGVETPRIRVDGALTAVTVPPGRHQVDLAYRPASVRLGTAFSLLGGALLVALVRGARGH